MREPLPGDTVITTYPPVPTSGHPSPDPRDQLLWAAIDFDGTLAQPMWTPDCPTSELGDPIANNVYQLRELHDAGYKIVIHTARPWSDYEAIELWLRHYELPFSAIVCGKILAAVYVDDRAIHADEDWLDRAYQIAPLKEES